MTDDQLRALVRDAVARHLGRPTSLFATPGRDTGPVTDATIPTVDLAPALAGESWAPDVDMAGGPTWAVGTHVSAAAPGGIAVAAAPGAVVHLHISHATFSLPPLSQGHDDGPCDLDPRTDCSRCGFCRSYGH